MGEFFCPKHGQRWYFDYSKDAAKPDKQCVLCIQENNAALRARAEKAEQFRDAVIDALVVSHIYIPEHDTNPRKALNDLIRWEQKIALDPLVSSDARALIERAVAGCAEDCAIQVAAREKAEQENARLREAIYLEIEEMARNWNDAPDVVRSALVIVARRVREESAPPSSPSGS